MPPGQLARLLREMSPVPSRTIPDASEAWRQARSAAGPQDLIVVTGSVFLAGELRPKLVAEQSS
jgi:dihydrofolate synthase/folylpolyglutamate synthase